MAAEDLYNFEVLIPDAVKEIFTQRSIQAFTISDSTDFQNYRPRVEIKLEMKGEVQPKILKKLDDGSMRAAAFRGDLHVWIISDTSAAGRVAHSGLRANVRDVAAGLERDLNDGSRLPNHAVRFPTAGNEETGIHQDKGYLMTAFTFSLLISIQDNAWSLLN